MNYQKIYDDLVNSRKNRIKEPGVYYERHHIIPKCLGGNNSKDNIIVFTAKEHYIAHLLLASIHPNSRDMASAIFLMSTKNDYRKYRYIPGSKTYERLKINYSKLFSGEGHHSYGKIIYHAYDKYTGKHYISVKSTDSDSVGFNKLMIATAISKPHQTYKGYYWRKTKEDKIELPPRLGTTNRVIDLHMYNMDGSYYKTLTNKTLKDNGFYMTAVTGAINRSKPLKGYYWSRILIDNLNLND